LSFFCPGLLGVARFLDHQAAVPPPSELLSASVCPFFFGSVLVADPCPQVRTQEFRYFLPTSPTFLTVFWSLPRRRERRRWGVCWVPSGLGLLDGSLCPQGLSPEPVGLGSFDFSDGLGLPLKVPLIRADLATPNKRSFVTGRVSYSGFRGPLYSYGDVFFHNLSGRRRAASVKTCFFEFGCFACGPSEMCEPFCLPLACDPARVLDFFIFSGLRPAFLLTVFLFYKRVVLNPVFFSCSGLCGYFLLLLKGFSA